jgi:hypothetical protein
MREVKMSGNYTCIVSKPGALDLARYAYNMGLIRLVTIDSSTYQCAVRRGWPTPDTDTESGFIRQLSWIFTKKNWKDEFLKKAIENEENFRLAANESGAADIMVPSELFEIKNGCYVVKYK